MIIKLTKSNETKNMLYFTSPLVKEICVMKSDFISVIKKFQLWHTNAVLESNLSDFTSKLFDLICKSDYYNQMRFLKAFPVEMIVYSLWYHAPTEKYFYETWGNIKIEELKNPAETLFEINHAIEKRYFDLARERALKHCPAHCDSISRSFQRKEKRNNDGTCENAFYFERGATK